MTLLGTLYKEQGEKNGFFKDDLKIGGYHGEGECAE
jgi:hypothetical protein